MSPTDHVIGITELHSHPVGLVRDFLSNLTVRGRKLTWYFLCSPTSGEGTTFESKQKMKEVCWMASVAKGLLIALQDLVFFAYP